MPSPIIADPTFLPPDQTPEGDWRLWAHSLVGLHAYRSDDGFGWRRCGTVTRNALRAQILREAEGQFRLSYEKTKLFLPLGRKWSSWIESRTSTDLLRWSDPDIVLRPSLSWHHDERRGEAVSNPCLVPVDGHWRLYYSAGLTLVPDCGFAEPTYIGVAEGSTAAGPFTSLPEPLLAPADGPADLACGAIKVMRVADGWVGFQNAISWDAETEASSSAIWVLGSTDGLSWRALSDTPAVAPGGPHWRATHVYALDVRDTPVGPRMYFNARDAAHWTKGRERIGVAMPRSPRERTG